jgi:hypothetical protein
MFGAFYAASKIGTAAALEVLMRELILDVPTCNIDVSGPPAENAKIPDFGAPYVPLLVRSSSSGVRVVLGSHDYWEMTAPDVQIERRPGGWVIFLHPMGGGDPSGYVCFLDDGRSFVVQEPDLGTTPPVMVVEGDDIRAELDARND